MGHLGLRNFHYLCLFPFYRINFAKRTPFPGESAAEKQETTLEKGLFLKKEKGLFESLAGELNSGA
ncbi:hypothetical protein CDO73_04160 [Saccharibacillus sp. O23]|uniref:hypothetical protein n=1 Tax=Saccharibacillus sp. O23 TaxID=2009338 RepID=UPI000B4E2417|nr:hypothetical protein [Saccharibacillus sp. O23]OWR31687.1 hypothetical protein CDO73_04160 [Saccharibacillus sp. O23]